MSKKYLVPIHIASDTNAQVVAVDPGGQGTVGSTYIELLDTVGGGSIEITAETPPYVDLSTGGEYRINGVPISTDGGGSTILDGLGAPADGLGSAGEYYEDLTNRVLYGPKNATGWGAEQRVTVSGGVITAGIATWEYGLRVSFARAGRITKIRYQRHTSAGATLAFSIWNSGGTRVLGPVNQTDAGTGTFTVTLPTPLAVTAGSTFTTSYVATSGNSPIGTAPVTAYADTIDCTIIGQFRVVGTGFPTEAVTTPIYVEPVYEAGEYWPVSVRVPSAQPLDAELTAIAGLTSASNKLPFFTGSGTATVVDFTSQAQTLVAQTTPGAMRSTLGLVIGTDVAPARRTINAQTGTTFTPTALSNENTMVTLSNAAAITVTLPSNATLPLPTGAEIDFLWLGVGQPSFVAGSGATVNGTPGLKLRAQYSACTAKVIAASTWILVGDLAA